MSATSSIQDLGATRGDRERTGAQGTIVANSQRAPVEHSANGISIGVVDRERTGTSLRQRSARDRKSARAAERVILAAVIERGASGADVGRVDVDGGCPGGDGVVEQHDITFDVVRRSAAGDQLPVAAAAGRTYLPRAAVQAGPLWTIAVDDQRDI